MKHEPFEDWIFAGQPLIPEEEAALQAHLVGCEACERLEQAWRQVENKLQQAPVLGPRPGFAARWQERLEAERARLHRRQSLVALGFILLGIFLMLGSLVILALPILGRPDVLLWAWLSRVVTIFSTLDAVWEFGATIFGSAAGAIPWFGWILLAGLLSELAVLWVVSFRLLTNPGRASGRGQS